MPGVIAIAPCVLGKKHIDYAVSLNNLARRYQTTGAYGKAEPPFYLVSMAIRSKELGKKRIDHAASLNKLAVL